jgi:fluoroacetyl-CoA thioesterase
MSPPHIDNILSTSRMIALMEDTCLAAVQPLLGEGQTTVGTRVDVSHVGTARVGEEVTVRIRLEKITRSRLLSFEVEVAAPDGIISTGAHQRLVVERSRFTPTTR